MRRGPGYTAVAVLTLAAGIAANTTIFSVVRSVLLRPLPYRDPDRLVTVLIKGISPVSPADFLDWKAQARSFSAMAGAGAWDATITGRDQAEDVVGLQLGPGLFDMLGVAPLAGRTPAPQEYQPGRDNVLVLGYGLWQRLYGGDPRILGRTVVVNGRASIIIGIMPERFRFAPFWVTQAEVWAPLALGGQSTNRRARFMRVFARLKAGVSIAQAQHEMDGIAARLAQAYPESNAGVTVRVTALQEQVVGNVRPALLVLAGAVGFVLLIACVNTAGLALARAVDRRREIAVRLARGASRARIARQLLTESLLVSCAGGLLGTAGAFAGIAALKSFLDSGAGRFAARLPRTGEIGIDAAALAVTGLVSLASGALFGLAPVLEALRAPVDGSLKEGGRGGAAGSLRSTRLRSALVVAEVAMALVLLAGAGLLMRSFLRLRAFDPGFDPRSTLTANLSISSRPQYVGAAREAFYRRVLDDMQTLPGVASASMINHLPIGGDVWGDTVFAEGQPLPRPGEELGAVYRVVRPGYFRTLRIRLLAGRDFTDRDGENAPPVVIVNRALARKLWPNESAIGKRLTREDPRRSPVWLTVAGVIGDVAQRWSDLPDPEFYLPFRQDARSFAGRDAWTGNMTLVVRTASDPAALANAVRAKIRAIDKDVAVSAVRPLEEVVAHAMWQQRLYVLVLGLFAAFALLLAAVGIYGVMAYAVGRRRHEIGVRMALGARQAGVRWMVLRQGLLLAGWGIAAGLTAAFLLTRWLEKLLYQVPPSDPATFAAVPAILAAVALLASYVPARRASAVDPSVALRAE